VQLVWTEMEYEVQYADQIDKRRREAFIADLFNEKYNPTLDALKEAIVDFLETPPPPNFGIPYPILIQQILKERNE